MPWMVTSSGIEFDLVDVDWRDINATDIAHSLAIVNRYTGHTIRPCSVAEHSLLVEEIMRRRFGWTSPAALLAGLLHDGHEMICNDVSTPWKDVLGEGWRTQEKRVERLVLGKFFVLMNDETRASIRKADIVALATEARDLMPPFERPWPVLDGVVPAEWVNLRTRDHVSWMEWRRRWRHRFEELVAHVSNFRGGTVDSSTP